MIIWYGLVPQTIHSRYLNDIFNVQLISLNQSITRELSKTNNTNQNNNPNILKKLRSINPTNRYRRQRTSSSRKWSNLNTKNSDKYEQNINEPQEETKNGNKCKKHQ